MSKVYLVGYGTLLLQASLADTIGRDASNEKDYLPVVVPGYRRLFNLRPTHYEPSYLTTRAPIEAAAMNVEPAPTNMFNGVAFLVSDKELLELDERELYYKRCKAPFFDFRTRNLLGEGYFYCSVLDAEWIERDPKRLLPLWRDVFWARRGAYSFGSAFGCCYDQTTFLADGRTLVVDHFRDMFKRH